MITSLEQINRDNTPRHVAIIMDGNGRWAKKRGFMRLFGHNEGTKTIRDIVEAAVLLRIQVLTLYAFSTENWTRPSTEIDGLMAILKNTLKSEEAHLNKNNVRLLTIGDTSKLPLDVQDQLETSKKVLDSNTGLKLVLALNYGARQEIVRAVNQLIEEKNESVSEELLASRLYTAGLPDPDLVIRTSGEYRVSNFLLWQIAYAELYITPVLWPDFKREHFFEAILAYQSRERRYGAVRPL